MRLSLWRCAILSLAAVRGALAWNREGHEAIGMTVMSALSSQAYNQIRRLLRNKDVADVAGWAHLVNEKFPATDVLHFQPQAFNSCKPLDLSECSQNRCLVRAIEHLYDRLIGKADGVAMEFPEDLQLSDPEALKYLITLLGDLHQPLHLGWKGDGCGRNISGTYEQAATGVKGSTSLFEAWDKRFIEQYTAEAQNFWFSGWTHTNTLGRNHLTLQKKHWNSVPRDEKNSVFEEWAADSLRLSCAVSYQDTVNRRRFQNGFHLDKRTIFSSFEFVKQRILTAGVRTAVVLNDILEAREATNLRQAPGIEKLIEAPKARSKTQVSKMWMQNMFINLSIFFIVLSVCWYIAKFYAGGSSDDKQGGPRGGLIRRDVRKEGDKSS